LRDFELNAGVADLSLGTHQALPHRGRRNQERVGNARGIEAKNGLEHKRRVHSRINRRMGTHEEQFQPFIWKLRRHSCLPFFPEELERGFARFNHLPMTHQIDKGAARRRQQPGLGILRHAISRPDRERRQQRIAESVLRGSQVVRVRGKVSHQTAI